MTMSSRSHFRRLIIRFLSYRQTLGLSGSTVRSDALALRQFAGWCRQYGLSHPGELTPDLFEAFGRFLRVTYRKRNGQPLQPSTFRDRLQLIRTFYRWLIRVGVVVVDPTATFIMPRRSQALPVHGLTPVEAELVLSLPESRSILGLRDRAIMETFYSTGIRCSELVHIHLSDLDCDARMLFIRRGKGKKDRVVPIGDRAGTWITRYCEIRPLLISGYDEGTLFLTVRGHPFSSKDVSKLVRGYLCAAGITRRGSCHLFRHGMATSMLENGADIRSIQEILGHASLSVTHRYTRVTIPHLRDVYERTHPFSR